LLCSKLKIDEPAFHCVLRIACAIHEVAGLAIVGRSRRSRRTNARLALQTSYVDGNRIVGNVVRELPPRPRKPVILADQTGCGRLQSQVWHPERHRYQLQRWNAARARQADVERSKKDLVSALTLSAQKGVL